MVKAGNKGANGILKDGRRRVGVIADVNLEADITVKIVDIVNIPSTYRKTV